MNIERKWWFRGAVGVFTMISSVALFYYAGQWPIGPRSISGWLVFFFCLLGLQRAYTGLFGVATIIFMPVALSPDQKR
jgi:hypothetical protein